MVRVKREATEIVGKKITFSVTASDDSGEVGFGTHERFIINLACL